MNIAFDPEKIGMVLCPLCDGKGFTMNPKRKPCPKCGEFGLISIETEQAENTSTNRLIANDTSATSSCSHDS